MRVCGNMGPNVGVTGITTQFLYSMAFMCVRVAPDHKLARRRRWLCTRGGHGCLANTTAHEQEKRVQFNTSRALQDHQRMFALDRGVRISTRLVWPNVDML